MAQYVTKPVVIEARRWDGTVDGAGSFGAEGATLILKWIRSNQAGARWLEGATHDEDRIAIDTLEGTVTASVGDYIIRGVQGEFYPCKPDIFAATYEAVVARDERPHSRACGIIPHDHGTGCHSNCPTCGGV